MKKILVLIVLSLLSLQISAQKVIRCTIQTTMGNIEIEIYPSKAPLSSANFLRYVDAKRYDNSSFFRVCTPENELGRAVKIQVIQGGDLPDSLQFEPINLESTVQTGLHHQNGTLSMARDTPHSATSSFFICIGEQPELDFAGKRNPDGQGFAAFGKVTKGMNVIRQIQVQKEQNQYLTKPVKILSIRRTDS